MKINEIGEFGFIKRFSPMFSELLPNQTVGIGDDCAIIPNGDEDWLISTDLLMEDVHFLRNDISPENLGHKSLAVNLSDIAAMGGTPIGSFLSIAIPKEVEVEYLDAFMKGYFDLSKKYNTPLLGGDTTKSLKHLAINVCVIGKCAKGMAKQRNMAHHGDTICVTGPLGDSAGGLQLILNKQKPDSNHFYLIKKHYQPEPRIAEGQFLALQPGVHAMIDISDGIASDLVHILNASGKAASIHLDRLPVSEVLANAGAKQRWNAMELAVSGGEDYELLCTISPENFESVSEAFKTRFGKPLIPIGTIGEGEPSIAWYSNGKEVKMKKSGFNHFQ